MVETDVLATIKKEVEEDEIDEDTNYFEDNSNVYVQLKTEDTTEDDVSSTATSTTTSSNSSSYRQKRKSRTLIKYKSIPKSSSSKNDYSKRVRSCRWCSEQFKGYHTLRKHESKHHREQFNKDLESKSVRHMGCSFCFGRFYAVKDMNIHIKTVHAIDPELLSYHCAHCSFSNSQKSKLEAHVKSVHFGLPGKSFKCSYCDVRCVSQQNLKKHLATKHKLMDPNVLFCDKCNFSSKVKAKISLHMQRVHLKSVNDFLCNSCEVVCQNKKERDLHHFAHCDIAEKIDQSKEKLTCTLCREQFSERVDLLDHLESHRNEVEFHVTPCILCYKPVSGYVDLVEHTKQFHATKNCYRCRECNRCYPYGLKFLMHIQNHKNSNQTHLCPGMKIWLIYFLSSD